ncbi:MAG: response regulator transcription factor [Christensenellales bacterium]
MIKKYKVLIVEDQMMPRQLFEDLVTHSDIFELVAAIDNADVADIYCAKNSVDLVLMDVLTKNAANGLEAAKRIKTLYPGIKIIIVTSMPEFSYIEKAKSIGVEGFWYKDISTDSILSVMNRVVEGETVYPDRTPELILGNASSYDFTEKELEVLREMTGGYTNQEIADKVFMSVGAVKAHILSMLEKTGFRNRTELAVRAREIGLVILDRKEQHKTDD